MEEPEYKDDDQNVGEWGADVDVPENLSSASGGSGSIQFRPQVPREGDTIKARNIVGFLGKVSSSVAYAISL